ncbi:MAG: SHD1 domain-containing protein [Planctomycetota bacterium]|nr:SHD1 domain-containing protein [Planctomycetota bacterium]
MNTKAFSFSGRLLACTLAWGLLLAGAQGSYAQEKFLEWSDDTGRFKVDAQYLRVEGEQLVLKRADGREIKIPFERLSPESLELARSKSGMTSPRASSPKPALSDPKSAASPEKKSPEKTSPAASASESSRPVMQFQDNMDPKEFIDRIFKETSQDNYIVMWDAMPASKQKQLEELMVAFASKVDVRSFDMIRKTRNSLIEILRKQQNYILNSTVIGLPPDIRSEFEPSYPAMVDVADSLVAKDLLDGKRMQQGNMRGLLDGYLTKLLKSVDTAILTLPTSNPIRSQYEDAKILNKPNWQVEKTSSTTATLSIPQAPGGPPPPPPIALVLSEGRWLPEELVKNWDTGISQAKALIATMDAQKIQQGLTTGLLVANAPLNNLKNAKSQSEFDKTLGELSNLASGLAQMAGPRGPGGAPAGPPGSGFAPR